MNDKSKVNEPVSELVEILQYNAESENFYQTVFENTGIATLIFKKDNIILLVNGEFEKIAGYAREEVEGKKTWMEFVHRKDDLERMKEYRRLRLLDPLSAPKTYEFQLVNRDGHIKDIVATVTTIPRTKQTLMTLLDITERKQMEAALQESERRLADIIDFLPDATFAVDLSGKVIAWNLAMEEMTGVKAKDMLGKGDHEYAIPFYGIQRPVLIDLVFESAEEIEKNYDFVKREGDVLLTETRMAVGTPPLVLWGKARPLYDGSGNVAGAIESVRDITEIRQAQEHMLKWSDELQQQVAERTAELTKANKALQQEIIERERTEAVLKESEKKYNEFFKTSRDCVFIASNDGKIIDINDASIELFGYPSREELLKVKTTDLYANPEERAKHLSLITKRGYAKEFPVDLRRKDGSIRHTLITTTARYNVDGNAIGNQGTIRDITERKQAEEALEKRIIALTKPLDDTRNINFEDLFNLADLQRLQDMLADSWGVAVLLTRPDGTAITQPSNFTSFCEIIRENEKGLKNCQISDAELGQYNPSGPIIHKCSSAGLWGAGTSITVGGRHIADWLIGQVRNEAQNEERVMEYAREIGIDETVFREAFLKVPVMPQEKFEQIAHTLFALANQLSAIAYQNIQQARFIADRKLAEEALRESETKYRRLHESMTEAFVRVDMEGRVQETNRAFQTILGYSEEELRQLTYMDITPEKWRVFEESIVEEQILVHGSSKVYEKEYQRKGGSIFPVEVSAFLIRDDAGHPAGIWAIVRDITERKKMETELKAAKDYLRTVINNVYDAILIHDLDGKVIDVNDKMLEMYRVSREEAIELNVIRDYSVTDESPEETLSVWNKVMSGEHIFTEWKARRPKDGSVFDVEVFLTKLSLPDGNHILSNVRDITERKRTEKELEEQRRQLEDTNRELESFSYSVSHDLRAPLRAIDGFSRMILKKQGAKFDEETLNRFNVIRRNTETMGQLIDGLLELSRLGRKAMTMSTIDMDNLIREVWEEIEVINPERKMSLTVKPAPQGFGDRQLIRQVYSNLLANAVKFTKNRDVALIETGGFIDDAKGNVYYVKDNGAGFDMTYHNKLFGVFQRLHSVEEFEGTGIGLATIQRIINKHGGRVWAEGKVDEGATFYFSLPASPIQR